MKMFFTLLALSFSAASGFAASLVVDSFTEGEFMLSLGGDTSANSAVASPLGARRAVSISNRLVAPGSTITSTLDADVGSLSFYVNGQSTGNSPLRLSISYSEGGPFSLLGYDAFEFEFSSLSGTGFLIAEIGSPSATYPSETTNRIALGSPGAVVLPFSDLNFGNNGSIDSFHVIHFVFEAESQEFSFGLDEIRVVPEASTMLLIAFGAGSILLRRRRH